MKKITKKTKTASIIENNFSFDIIDNYIAPQEDEEKVENFTPAYIIPSVEQKKEIIIPVEQKKEMVVALQEKNVIGDVGTVLQFAPVKRRSTPPLPTPTRTFPKWVFIVPYRDRETQYTFFTKHMKQTILEDVPQDEYSFLFIHQTDTRDFNRGAMKNIGFLFVKEKYPENYKDICLIFNDIDTVPAVKGLFDYQTTKGKVKHFYGFTYALGGVVSIMASDFEKTGGFPNLWAWGFEDNMLNHRVLEIGLEIDRSQFYPFMDKNVIQIHDGTSRSVNRKEYDRFRNITNEGFRSIRGLTTQYNIDTGFVDVLSFQTDSPNDPSGNSIHDLKKGSVVFPASVRPPLRRGATMGMIL